MHDLLFISVISLLLTLTDIPSDCPYKTILHLEPTFPAHTPPQHLMVHNIILSLTPHQSYSINVKYSMLTQIRGCIDQPINACIKCQLDFPSTIIFLMASLGALIMITECAISDYIWCESDYLWTLRSQPYITRE